MASALERIEAARAKFPPLEIVPLEEEDRIERIRRLQKEREEREKELAAKSIPGIIEKGQEAPPGLLQILPTSERLEEAQIAAGVGQEQLGTESLELGTRAALGFQDTFAEQEASFAKRFPAGELRSVDGEILFRRNPEETFSRVDKSAFLEFEPFGDLADITGDIPEIAGETLGAILAGGASLTARLLSASTGAFLGEIGQQGVQALAGTQRDDPKEALFDRPTIVALQGLFGEATGDVFRGSINVLRGIPLSKPLKGGRQAQFAAKRLELSPLREAQISSSPIIRRLTAQSAALSTPVAEYVRQQARDLTVTLKALKGPARQRFLRGDLEGLSRDINRDIQNLTKTVVDSKTKTFRETGGLLKAAVADWDAVANSIVSASYGRARNIDAPTFNLGNMKDEAESLLQGLPAALSEEGAIRRGLVPDVATVDVDPIQGELRDIARTIIDLDPNLPAVEVTLKNGQTVTVPPTEALRALQQRARDLSLPAAGQAPGRVTPDQAKAKKLTSSIRDTLENPTNADPKFRKAWNTANRRARERFEIQEKMIIREASKTETPGQLAARVFAPGQADNVITLKQGTKAKDFNEVVQAGTNSLLEDFESFPRKWNALVAEGDTINQLYSPKQIEELTGFSAAVEKLNALDVPGILQRQAQRGAMVDDLVNRGDTQAIETLLTVTLDKPGVRESIRAGIMENIAAKALPAGSKKVSNEVIFRELNKLRDTGAIEFLSLRDIRRLKDIDTVREFISGLADAGTSIEAASVAAQARSNPIAAVFEVIKAAGVGRLLISDAGDRILGGTAKGQRRKAIGPRFSDMIAAVTQLNADFEKTQFDDRELNNGP